MCVCIVSLVPIRPAEVCTRDDTEHRQECSRGQRNMRLLTKYVKGKEN